MIDRKIVDDFILKLPQIKSGDFSEYFSKTRDIFDARLQSFIAKNQNWLFDAAIGEIGANTFDHNFSFSSDAPKGVFCDFETKSPYVFMCDFGAGLKATLSRVEKDIDSDIKAIETAFTKEISGRAPELRGNGLKFVISSVVQNGWEMFFQSGNAVCQADASGYVFENTNYVHNGIFCILLFKDKNSTEAEK